MTQKNTDFIFPYDTPLGHVFFRTCTIDNMVREKGNLSSYNVYNKTRTE